MSEHTDIAKRSAAKIFPEPKRTDAEYKELSPETAEAVFRQHYEVTSDLQRDAAAIIDAEIAYLREKHGETLFQIMSHVAPGLEQTSMAVIPENVVTSIKQLVRSEAELRDRLEIRTEQAELAESRAKEAVQQTVAGLRERLRTTCQILVECFGADGPCDAEEVAVRGVTKFAELRDENERLTFLKKNAEAENERLRELIPQWHEVDAGGVCFGVRVENVVYDIPGLPEDVVDYDQLPRRTDDGE